MDRGDDSEGFGSGEAPMTDVERANSAEFTDAILIAASLYSDVELAFWLTAPHPLLDMWTPVQLLARGEAGRLLSIMRGLEDGAYV